MKTVPLHGKHAPDRICRVDDEDYEVVAGYRWRVLPSRPTTTGSRVFYATACIPGPGDRRILMHNLLTGWPRVDHEDRDGLNNQRYNLRKTDDSRNNANRGKLRADRATSRYKGVWQTTGVFRAEIQNRYLGSFGQDEIAAARAYNLAALETWGPYALLNDIPEEAASE